MTLSIFDENFDCVILIIDKFIKKVIFISNKKIWKVTN